MKKLTLIAFATIFILALAFSVSAQDNNLLTNPGFEDPYVSRGNTTPSGQSVANGWNAWHVPRAEGAPDFENREPEYYEAVRSDRVRSGNNAQRYESFFATHTGGVFQVVNGLPSDTEITFTVYAYVWSSGLDDEDQSVSDGDVLIQVGIDPTGGTDGTSENILWSVPQESYDSYNAYQVSAITEGESVSVWIRSRVGFAVKTSRIYLDDASLNVEGGAVVVTEEPTAEATSEPVVTDEPTEEVTPEPVVTDEVTVEPATPTPDGGDTPLPTSTPISSGGTGGPTDGRQPSASGFSGNIVHTVQSGDTLARLAARYGSTTEAIQSANGLGDSALIFVNQSLLIPVRLIPSTSTPTATPVVMVVTATPIAAGGGGTGGPVPVVDNSGVYVVQPGDTLSAIARRYNTTIAALAQLNGIVNANSILVGQQLNVPEQGGAVVDAGTDATPIPTPSPTPQIYVVQPGDNLYRISLRFNVSLAQLIQVNNITDANRIFVGQRLTLP